MAQADSISASASTAKPRFALAAAAAGFLLGIASTVVIAQVQNAASEAAQFGEHAALASAIENIRDTIHNGDHALAEDKASLLLNRYMDYFRHDGAPPEGFAKEVISLRSVKSTVDKEPARDATPHP